MTTMTFTPETLYHLPPGDLLLERNIRDAAPSAELVMSIADVGVLQPITAVTNADGALVVRDGHRRTLAAVEANQVTVPVYVTGTDDLADAAEVDRIIRQHDANSHREGLTAGDEVKVVEQLAAFGLTAEQIHEQARIHEDTVGRAMAVSKSKLARKSAEKYSELTLDQAAAVAEFEDDPETAKALLVCALDSPNQFPHALQRQRDDRVRAARKAEIIAELQAAGVKVVDSPNWDSKTKPLHRVAPPGDAKAFTPSKHKNCPGHVAWVSNSEAVYGCSDLAKNGHRDLYSSGSGKPAAADMTEEEREKAKAERKLVIDNNKAWDSAQTVRRLWLATFAKSKTAPKGTAAFLAHALGHNASLFTQVGSDTLAADWLGSTVGGYNSSPVAALAQRAAEGKALQILLVMVLSGYEVNTDRMDWRRNGKTSATGHYLRFLEACGYGLSDVEKFALNSKTV